MNNQNQSDIVSIIQDTANFFSLKEIGQISESDYNLLLSRKPITCNDKIDNYISFIFVIYNNKYYPFIFYKVKQYSKNSISIDGDPIISKPTLNLLSKIGIEENEIHKSSDINSVVINLLGLIERKGLSIKLTNGISFYSTKDLISQDIFEYLNNYLYLEKNNKIDTVINSKKSDSELNVDFYNYTNVINQFTKENKVSKVVLENLNLCKNYIYNLISEILSQEGVVILSNNRDEKKKLNHEIKKIFGENLVYTLEDINKIIKNEKQLKNKTDFTLKDIKLKKEYSSFKENSAIYFESLQQVEGIYKRNKLKELLLENVSKPTTEIKFNIDTYGYSRKDFSVDDEFFKNIRKLKSVLSSHITNHKFYGIEENTGINEYSKVKQLISEIINCLNNLLKDINNFESFSLDDKGINTFKEIENLNYNFQLISNCRGIPLEVFEKDFSSDIKQIDDLKKSYQKLSSSKLVIQNLATKNIFDLDFSALIKRCHSKNIIERFSAHRQVFSFLKIKKRNQVKPLIDVIEKYDFSKKKVNELLPKVSNNFNEKISTLEGVNEIENTYNYITEFKSVIDTDPTYSITNPKIKLLLTDDEEYFKFKNSLDLVIKTYNECKDLINQYINIFINDKRDFVNVSINDNLNFFKNKYSGTSKEFEEYIDYLNFRKNISTTLDAAINKCIEEKVSLESLSSFFFSNLMNINYDESRREISLFKSEMDKNKNFYYQNIKLINDFINLERKEKVNIKKTLPSDINESKNILKENYIDDISDKKFKEILSNQFVLVLTLDDLVGLDDNIFNNLIVYDKSNYDNSVILDCLRLSDKVYFVEEKGCINQFTRNCLVSDLSISTLLNKQFDFSNFDKEIFNQLNEFLSSKHLKIVKEDFYYIVDEKKDYKYILIPSSTLKGPIVSKELNEAFNFIYSSTNNKIMYLDVTKFNFEKKEAFNEMLQPYYK